MRARLQPGIVSGWRRLLQHSLLIALAASGTATWAQQAQQNTSLPMRPGFVAGYLAREQLPSSVTLVPLPPADGSAAQALDEALSHKSLELRDTPRWALAAEDADLSFPHAPEAFSCALGVPITQQGMPRLYQLMQRSLSDAALSTYAAKNQYQRVRPFLVNGAPMCTPADEALLKASGSYPSGHAAIGWSWALILSEVAPDRADALLSRGRAFGQSRVVCNVHWDSDVIEGRVMGAATVARLHADPHFLADLHAARREFTAVRARGAKLSRDCAAEAAALALEPPPAP